jgi:CO/xanthine dehydrogenase FAD-binding subunit
VTIGGLSYAPERVREAEAVPRERPSTPDTFRAAADACGALEAGSDIHGSASYRQQRTRVLTYRALAIAHERVRPAQVGRHE